MKFSKIELEPRSLLAAVGSRNSYISVYKWVGLILPTPRRPHFDSLSRTYQVPMQVGK